MYTNLPFENIEEVSKDYPSRLIVALYDEAIAGLTASIEAIARDDIEERFNATTRTAEVIAQLYLALDMKLGGEIAETLGAIYNYILTQLPRINFTNDIDVAEQAIGLLRPIRDSWSELDERIRSEVESAEAQELSTLAAELVIAKSASGNAAA
jgi:flagellar protein FliS